MVSELGLVTRYSCACVSCEVHVLRDLVHSGNRGLIATGVSCGIYAEPENIAKFSD